MQVKCVQGRQPLGAFKVDGAPQLAARSPGGVSWALSLTGVSLCSNRQSVRHDGREPRAARSATPAAAPSPPQPTVLARSQSPSCQAPGVRGDRHHCCQSRSSTAGSREWQCLCASSSRPAGICRMRITAQRPLRALSHFLLTEDVALPAPFLQPAVRGARENRVLLASSP